MKPSTFVNMILFVIYEISYFVLFFVDSGRYSAWIGRHCVGLIWPLYSSVGWLWTFFYIFNKSTPQICYNTYLPNVAKIAKKKFLTQWPLHHWWLHFGACTIKSSKKIFPQYGLHGYQRCRILCRFQKYKLTLVTKCT
jgi:hypothetical protein